MPLYILYMNDYIFSRISGHGIDYVLKSKIFVYNMWNKYPYCPSLSFVINIGNTSPYPMLVNIGNTSPYPMFINMGFASPYPMFINIGFASHNAMFLNIGNASSNPMSVNIGNTSP